MHSLLLLPLLFVPLATSASEKCYGLNGTELDDTYGPCKSGARHSGCCAIHRPAGSVDICLDNGLCMATNDEFMGTIWQDGCTDPTGQDAGCPKMCPDGTYSLLLCSRIVRRTNSMLVRDDFGGLKPVLAWNIQMCDYGTYCCREVNDRTNCCNNATAPKISTNFLGAFQFETSTAGASATAVPVSVTSAPASSTSEPTRVVATAVSTGSPFATAPPQEDVCQKEKDKTKAVGGAVGGILGAALIGLVALILWMHKKEKRQRKLKEHYEAQFEQSWAYRRTLVVESDSKEVILEKDTDYSQDPKERQGET